MRYAPFLGVMELNKKDGSPFFVLGLGVCFVIALALEAYMQSHRKSGN